MRVRCGGCFGRASAIRRSASKASSTPAADGAHAPPESAASKALPPPCEHASDDQEDAPFVDALEDAFDLDPEVLRAYALDRVLIAALEDWDGFVEARGAKDDPQVHYRRLRGSQVHSVKYSASYAHAPDQVLALGREFDHIAWWNPFALAPRIVREWGDTGMVGHTRTWLPWPFNYRSVLVRVDIRDLTATDRRCWMVTIGDANAEDVGGEAAMERATRGNGKTRVSFLAGSCVLVFPATSPHEGGTHPGEGSGCGTRVFIAVHADPLVFAPPKWLVRFVLRIMAPTIHRSVQRALLRAYGPPRGEGGAVKGLEGKGGEGQEPNPFADALATRPLYGAMRGRLQAAGWA